MKIEITKKEAQLIIGALAFTSCTDVCEDTKMDDKYKMIALANVLKEVTKVDKVPDFYLTQQREFVGDGVFYCDDLHMIDKVKQVIEIFNKDEE
jgi:hypothetical protein